MISPQEAAEILGLSRPRIYQLIDAGTLPAVKFGKGRRAVVLIRRGDLEKVKKRPGPGRPPKEKDAQE
jgi:excisionase family DNA binding protein